MSKRKAPWSDSRGPDRFRSQYRRLRLAATGWSCYTSKGQTGGDKLADCLCQAAARILHGHKMRFDYSDGDPDQEADFTILSRTACAACLTESGFMDSEESLNFLLSPEGKEAIVQLHVEGIIAYVKNRERELE